MFAGLIWLVYAQVQLSEAMMATRDKRAQFDLQRERECVAVVAFSVFRRFGVDRDLAKKVEGVRLATALPTFASHG